MVTAFAEMLKLHAAKGQVAWIGLRPARREDLLTPDESEITLNGLNGDHSKAGKRAITLIQKEHCPSLRA